MSSSTGMGVRSAFSGRSSVPGLRENSSIMKGKPWSEGCGSGKNLFSSATFACLIAASIRKFFESGAEGGIDHLNAKHHVDILGGPEIEASFIEQEVPGRATDDGVVVLMASEVFLKLIDAGYQVRFSKSPSAAMATRSSRCRRNCAYKERTSTLWVSDKAAGS